MMGGSGVASAPLGQLSAGSARRFRPYPAYKDSGIEWLGEIPANWEVKKWRYCCRVTEGQVAPDDEHYRERIMIAPNHIEPATGRILFTETADEQGAISGKYLVKPGDIIYSKIRPALNKACIAEGDWLCSADMYPVAITRQGLTSTFLLYFILSEPFVRLMVDESMRVAMPKVNREKLAACPLVMPPTEDQRAIAAFLDREAARIDALVAKKERLIELLREKRSALITRAVTKGLDPNVPMRDSGVEWLGEIPAHWEVMKSTWLFSIGSGTTPRSEDPTYYGGGIPWVTTSELRESVVDSTEKSVTEEALRDLPSLVVHPKGSVAVAMYGATIGRLGILGVDAAVNQACCVFSRPRGIDAKFWFFWLQMRRPHLISLGYGGGQPNLSQELLRSMRVPTPPEHEQHAVATFLDCEIAKIDALVAKVREAIARLQEFRSALISAAVTGKIDVREEPLREQTEAAAAG